MLESMEQRLLLFAAVDDGVLVVVGTRGNDTITVSFAPGPPEQAVVVRNGATRSFPLAGISSVLISAARGNDAVTMALPLPSVLIGGRGNDTLASSEGNDMLSGGHGHDMLQGEFGQDLLVGGKGNDRLFGGDSADVLFGGAGNDQINAGPGNDRLFGGHGDDTLDADDADLGRDTVSGGRGFDTAMIDDVAIYGNTDTVLRDVERVL